MEAKGERISGILSIFLAEDLVVKSALGKFTVMRAAR